MSVTTILLLVLFLGYTLYAKVNKSIGENVFEPENGPLKGEEMDADYVENDETQPSPYFSYETEAVETSAQMETASVYRQTAHKAPIQVNVAETYRPQFDLRQAVISQVILTNSYINEINQ